MGDRHRFTRWHLAHSSWIQICFGDLETDGHQSKQLAHSSYCINGVQAKMLPFWSPFLITSYWLSLLASTSSHTVLTACPSDWNTELQIHWAKTFTTLKMTTYGFPAPWLFSFRDALLWHCLKGTHPLFSTIAHLWIQLVKLVALR